MFDFSLMVSTMLDKRRVVFFFQAEDGIRDLVRSRGLGDVYKRQAHNCSMQRFVTVSFWCRNPVAQAVGIGRIKICNLSLIHI